MSALWHPVGARGSANHLDVILLNWAMLRGIGIGAFGHAGRSLSAANRAGVLGFVVEQRGQGLPIFDEWYPFCSRKERRLAWTKAKTRFEACP